MSRGGKREGAGSKPRSLTPSKNHSIKFTDEEWQLLFLYAKDCKVTISEYIRVKALYKEGE